MAKISVIIPAHNPGGSILRCLEAVLSSVKSYDCEVIVVDDASTDGALNKIAGFPVRVLRLENKCGAAAARNSGAAAASGDTLVFLDADVLPSRDWLVRILGSFGERPGAAAVQGVYDEDCPEKSLPALARNYYKCYNASKLTDGAFIAGLNSFCFAVRREVFKAVGGFDPASEMTEDVELAGRLARAGYRIALNKQLRVRHLKKYTFPGLLRCDFLKVFAKTRLALRSRRQGGGVTFSLNRAGSMSAEFITLGLAAAVPSCALCGLAFRQPALLWAAAFFGLAVPPLNYGFFSYMRRRAGFAAAAGCLAVYFCEMSAAAAAAAAGAAAYALGLARSAAGAAAEKLRWGAKMLAAGPGAMPEQVTLFVTDRCNLKCGHCFYKDELNKRPAEFTLEELARVLPTMGRFSFASLAGGEPFLRGDLPEIAGFLARVNGVRRISIPTNGYFTDRVLGLTAGILKACGGGVRLLVKVSLDGVGPAHDSSRGTSGSFDRAVATLEGLKRLAAANRNLKTGVLLTASPENEADLPRTAAYVMKELSPDVIGLNFLRGAAASCRRPDVAAYRRLYGEILDWTLSAKRGPGRLGRRFYRAYKEEISGLIEEITCTGRYPMPCYAGRLSAVIDSSLEVLPCELLGEKIGGLRAAGYDFRKLWLSAEAAGIRGRIAAGCCCTHECNLQMNSFFNPARAARLAVKTLLGGRAAAAAGVRL